MCAAVVSPSFASLFHFSFFFLPHCSFHRIFCVSPYIILALTCLASPCLFPVTMRNRKFVSATFLLILSLSSSYVSHTNCVCCSNEYKRMRISCFKANAAQIYNSNIKRRCQLKKMCYSSSLRTAMSYYMLSLWMWICVLMFSAWSGIHNTGGEQFLIAVAKWWNFFFWVPKYTHTHKFSIYCNWALRCFWLCVFRNMQVLKTSTLKPTNNRI